LARQRQSGPRLDPSLASAFRTSDWDRPNCRAICDGFERSRTDWCNRPF
jgi:hypothetical protein